MGHFKEQLGVVSKIENRLLKVFDSVLNGPYR